MLASDFCTFNPSVIVNETQFPEFIHEEINPRPRGSHHFRERGLFDFFQNRRDLIVFAVFRQQPERSRQPLFA